MEIAFDASPLIYLAKLDAFDACSAAGVTVAVPPSVLAEAARPELAFRHPEIAVIETQRSAGRLSVVVLSHEELALARELGARYQGLHAGELEVLSVGLSRGWPVCLHERQASRLASGLGVATIHLVEILAAGTPDLALLERRIRHFARLTNLTMHDLDVLLQVIRGPR